MPEAAVEPVVEVDDAHIGERVVEVHTEDREPRLAARRLEDELLSARDVIPVDECLVHDDALLRDEGGDDLVGQSVDQGQPADAPLVELHVAGNHVGDRSPVGDAREPHRVRALDGG